MVEMKKKILACLLLLVMVFPSCTKIPEDTTSDFISEDTTTSSQQVSSEEISENTENSESLESAESFESFENTESSENMENSENTESLESVESIESIESVESSESAESSLESEKPSSQPEENSEEESSYEVIDTPVIDVPDKLEASETDVFFNDSVFVGNSIMLGYNNFTKKQRAGSIPSFLGNAKFFTAGSWGVYHNNRTPASSSKATNPEYAGKKYSVEDVIEVMGVKTVYLNFMGLNDLALYGDSKNCSRKCADDVIKLIKKINDRYPDVKVVILSATYITASRNTYPSLNNKNLSLMNNYLLEYCNENGLDFIDIASQLTEKGCLADKYASDGYCHIGQSGYKIWTAILRDYAVRKQNGTYTNPEKMPILSINK